MPAPAWHAPRYRPWPVYAGGTICRNLRANAALCDNRERECVPRKLRFAEDEMGDLLQPWHLIVLLVVAFLLFGARRLPELGKGLGEGLKGFKEGIRGISDPP